MSGVLRGGVYGGGEGRSVYCGSGKDCRENKNEFGSVSFAQLRRKLSCFSCKMRNYNRNGQNNGLWADEIGNVSYGVATVSRVD